MLAEELRVQGIALRHYDQGQHKTTCPQCSRQRRHKSDKCLSVVIDDKGSTWTCHHCGWTGFHMAKNGHAAEYQITPTNITYDPELTPDLIAWFAARGISEEIIISRRIGLLRDTITFPYYINKDDTTPANIKYRGWPKKGHFHQIPNAPKLYYGLDTLVETPETVIIVEGEIDALSCQVAGFSNVLSVPDGAPQFVKDTLSGQKFSFVEQSWDRLNATKRIIIAVDSDGPGEALREELARRYGKARCWWVDWPEDCKDANDVLVQLGPEALKHYIDTAIPYPIADLKSVNDYADSVLTLYEDGYPRGLSTGFATLDELYTIAPGIVTVVTGYPGMGKSEFIDQLMINLVKSAGLHCCVASFENPKEEHIKKLMEKYFKLPFSKQPFGERMSAYQVIDGIRILSQHFHFIDLGEAAPELDRILDAARGSVGRYGTRVLVIDPYNELIRRRDASETDIVSEMMGKLCRFAKMHAVHIFFVAHPHKPRLQFDAENKPRWPVPHVSWISGSQNFSNKMDVGLVVHRDPDDDDVRIMIQKVRHKSTGHTGEIRLEYDIKTGTYSEPFDIPENRYEHRYDMMSGRA